MSAMHVLLIVLALLETLVAITTFAIVRLIAELDDGEHPDRDGAA